MIKIILLRFLGSIFYALSVNIFTAPNDIAPGGVTGLATILNYLCGVPIGVGILIFNTPLFIWSLKAEGKKVFSTLYTTVFSSVVIDITAPLLPRFTGDLFLVTVFGGVLSGAGLGLIFMSGATTGGSDLAASIITIKKPHIPIGRLMLYLDCAVIAVSAIVYRSFVLPMYALVIVFIAGKVVDGLLYGTKSGKLLYIISRKNAEISGQIMQKLERGVTVLYASGGYTGDEITVVMCAVKRHEISRIYDIVSKTDKNAFMIISDAAEISGEGFSV